MAYSKIISQLATWLTLLSLSAASSAFSAESIDGSVSEPRLSTTTFQGTTKIFHYPFDVRSGDVRSDDVSTGDVSTGDVSTKSRTKQSRANHSRRTIQHLDHGLWIYDVLINLTDDFDYDGHYSAFTVSIDVESDYLPTTVYAVLYLNHSHEPLQQYAVTGNFTVSGTGSGDAISLETTLDYGFPSGYYDHHVEIYDAWDHTLLASYGPQQSHHVHNIPFESYYNDHRVSPVSLRLSISGSGSITGPSIVFFITLLFIRRYTRKAA